MNYDPNLVLCGRMAKQKVVLTFQQWEYKLEVETEVGGNCTGLSVIDCAVGNIYDKLPAKEYGFVGEDDKDCPYITLKKEDGTECEFEDEDNKGEDWLMNMLVKAEIVSIEPDNG